MALEPASRVEDLDALRRLDTCTVSNAIETFELRLRNAGFADARIRCIFEDFPPMVGYAATARLRSGEPPIAGRIYVDRTDWWNSILQVPAPRIVVLEDLDKPPGVGAFLGDMQRCDPESAGLRRVCDRRRGARPAAREGSGIASFCRECSGVTCLRPYLRFWLHGQSGWAGSETGRPFAWGSAWALDRSQRDRRGNSSGCGETAGGGAKGHRFLPLAGIFSGEVTSGTQGVELRRL